MFIFLFFWIFNILHLIPAVIFVQYSRKFSNSARARRFNNVRRRRTFAQIFRRIKSFQHFRHWRHQQWFRSIFTWREARQKVNCVIAILCPSFSVCLTARIRTFDATRQNHWCFPVSRWQYELMRAPACRSFGISRSYSAIVDSRYLRFWENNFSLSLSLIRTTGCGPKVAVRVATIIRKVCRFSFVHQLLSLSPFQCSQTFEQSRERNLVPCEVAKVTPNSNVLG